MPCRAPSPASYRSRSSCSGGLNFISSDDAAYLAAAVNGLGFHPPSRTKMAGPLLGYLAGAPLEIV